MLSAAFGSFISGYPAALFGGRTVIFVLSIPSALSWIPMIFAKESLLIYISRAVTGFCMGLIIPPVAVFIAELSSPDMRGRFLSLTSLEQPVGALLCFGSSYFLDWRTLAIAGSLIPTLQLLCIIICPESPVWLVKNGKEQRAKKSLTWYRGTQFDIDNELNIIKENVEKTRNAEVLKVLFSKQYLKPIIVVQAAFFWMQFCGFPAMISYILIIFERGNINFISPSLNTIILGVNYVIFALIALLLIDKLGRRPLMLVSTSVAGLTQLGLAFYFYLLWKNLVTSFFSFIPFLLFQVFVMAFQVGLSNVAMVLIGELFPSYIRIQAVGIVIGITFVFIFAVTELFLPLSDNSHFYGGFLLFGINCLVDFIFMYFLLPETKGLRLEEVENGFA